MSLIPTMRCPECGDEHTCTLSDPVPAVPAPGEPAIKPCPFCGLAAAWYPESPSIEATAWCPDTRCAGSHRTALSAWNRRSVPLSDEGRELLRLALSFVEDAACTEDAAVTVGQRIRAYLSTPPSGRDELREAAQALRDAANCAIHEATVAPAIYRRWRAIADRLSPPSREPK